MFANAHLLSNKLRFAAELKNKNLRFLHAVSSYAKLSISGRALRLPKAQGRQSAMRLLECWL